MNLERRTFGRRLLGVSRMTWVRFVGIVGDALVAFIEAASVGDDGLLDRIVSQGGA